MEIWLTDHVTNEKPMVDYWQFDDDASNVAAPLPLRLFACKAIRKQKYGEKASGRSGRCFINKTGMIWSCLFFSSWHSANKSFYWVTCLTVLWYKFWTLTREDAKKMKKRAPENTLFNNECAMSCLNQWFGTPSSTVAYVKMIKNKLESRGGVNTEWSEFLNR